MKMWPMSSKDEGMAHSSSHSKHASVWRQLRNPVRWSLAIWLAKEILIYCRRCTLRDPTIRLQVESELVSAMSWVVSLPSAPWILLQNGVGTTITDPVIGDFNDDGHTDVA